jgi:hypothetical protein
VEDKYKGKRNLYFYSKPDTIFVVVEDIVGINELLNDLAI